MDHVDFEFISLQTSQKDYERWRFAGHWLEGKVATASQR